MPPHRRSIPKPENYWLPPQLAASPFPDQHRSQLAVPSCFLDGPYSPLWTVSPLTVKVYVEDGAIKSLRPALCGLPSVRRHPGLGQAETPSAALRLYLANHPRRYPIPPTQAKTIVST